MKIEWNDETKWILGRPNFTFIGLAQLYCKAGHDIPTQSEDEQAFFIHRWLNFYLEHGDAWRDHAEADLRATKEAAQ